MREGIVIAGRYRLLGRVGRGAGGAVWRAEDLRLERVVAVKQLFHDSLFDSAATSRTRARAIREARLAARLRHPHAIAVYDVVEEDSTPYLVMEYLPSRTLTDLVEHHGSLAPAEVAELGAQLASALAAAHAEGVLHRDISPGNVLITAGRTARIADFGISHARGEGTMTGRGLVVGTPAYLAPEVADGAVADFPSDVFSLGATLYTALEGRPPFGTDENQLALLKRVARGEISPPRTSGPVTDAVLRLLRRDPLERPTMAEAERLLSEPPSPKPATAAPGTPVPAQPRRSRGLLFPVIATAVLVTGVIVAGTSLAGGPGPGTPVRLAAAPPPSPSPTAEPPSCAARYQVVQTWAGGFQVLMTVRNSGHVGITGWTISWTYPAGTRVDDLWDGRLIAAGGAPAVANADWNATLKPGESTTFGFTALARNGNLGAPVTDCRPAG